MHLSLQVESTIRNPFYGLSRFLSHPKEAKSEPCGNESCSSPRSSRTVVESLLRTITLSPIDTKGRARPATINRESLSHQVESWWNPFIQAITLSPIDTNCRAHSAAIKRISLFFLSRIVYEAGPFATPAHSTTTRTAGGSHRKA